eukprot:COSAG01_NODE_7286_length_3269_cov_0.980126_3_plen_71_part_00
MLRKQRSVGMSGPLQMHTTPWVTYDMDGSAMFALQPGPECDRARPRGARSSVRGGRTPLSAAGARKASVA